MFRGVVMGTRRRGFASLRGVAVCVFRCLRQPGMTPPGLTTALNQKRTSLARGLTSRAWPGADWQLWGEPC